MGEVKVNATVIGETDDDFQKDAAGRSTQITADEFDYDNTGAQEPPYDPSKLAYFLETNTWHYRCVKAKAISTAGLGYDFVASEGVESPSEEDKKKLEQFFRRPNPEMTWGEILENVLTDFEAIGNGYFEFVRNEFGVGPPTETYHVPAVTVRVLKNRKGFIQQRGTKKVYFRNYGSDPTDPFSAHPDDRKKPLSERRILNEILHIKNYHPRSSYYGLPDFLPALKALVGDKKSGDYQVSFFDNNAIPSHAILVKGGELARGTRKRIEEYFREHIKGSAHKTLIIEVVSDEGEKVDVVFQKLSTEVKEASFSEYRRDNAEEVRVAHGVPGRLIGLTEKGGLGGAGEGATQQEIFKYHVIEPRQSRLEARINGFIIRDGFGIEDWEMRFKEIDVTDESKVSEITNRLVRIGVLTINEGRHAMGIKPLPDAGANVPFLMTATGPLTLDALAKGARPRNMPQSSKDLAHGLLLLRSKIEGELEDREGDG